MNMSPMYQNPYQNSSYMPYTTSRYNQSSNNGIIWVQGIEGAKAYQLMPNSNVILLDSDSDKFYIKTSDNVGMCNLRTFEFKEITESVKHSNDAIDTSQFVTREEFNQLVKQLGGLESGK